ncbi:MAG: FAD-dependent oxidoreductase [Polyangiaceae bacterium]
MSCDSMRVLVIGAGVFGAAAAVELRRRGHEVSLIDAGSSPHPDAASTDISKVVRLDYATDLFYTGLMEQAMPRWRQYNERWGRPLFHETGFVVLRSVAMEAGEFEHDSFTTLTARGHELERLDAESLGQRFPAWRSDAYCDGYYNPQGGWAESAEVVAALIAEGTERGVRVQSDSPVASLIEKGSRVCGVQLASGQRYEADCVVVACGAWTCKLLPGLASLLSVVGQPVVHFKPPEPGRFMPPDFVPWAADIAAKGWYGFCDNGQGIVKVAHHGPGVPCDAAGERSVPEAFAARVRDFTHRSLPALVDAPIVAHRLCLYCDSADGDFIIDRDPGREGLVVAAGGSGHGFKFMPILGDLIADVVEGGESLSRFAWRTESNTQRLTDAARCTMESHRVE